MNAEDSKLIMIWEKQSTFGPQPGERYQHYKGGFYKIVTRTLYKETRVGYTVYESELLGVRWLLSVDEFMAKVCLEDGSVAQRFTHVPE